MDNFGGVRNTIRAKEDVKLGKLRDVDGLFIR